MTFPSHARRSPATIRSLAALAVLGAGLPPAARAAEPPAAAPAAAWRPLFNGRDLGGWVTYVATPEGDAPLVPDADPTGVFTVAAEDGAGIVRVSGRTLGAITTVEEFDGLHFRVQYRWGLGRFGNRAAVARDTGILYAAVGPPDPRTGWMTSVENNIMEKGTGQWWSVNGAVIDAEGEWITDANELFVPYKREGRGERNLVWRRGAPRVAVTKDNGITPPFDVEQPFGNWNTVEVVFWGGQCIHVLNGRVNLVAVNPRHRDGDAWRPLARGRIQLQSEGAEVSFRKAEVRPLRGMPVEYREFMLSPAADEEGFTPLLTGTAAAAWRQAGPGKFTLADGVATAEGGMGLWWHAGRTFRNFVLRGEFLQEQAGADAGVFVRFPDPGGDPWVAVHRGHEFEIGETDPQDPQARTGSVYPFAAATEAATKPPGQWNAFEVVCTGHDYSMRINGRVVTTWTDPAGRSLQGHVGLQNYADGKTVRFRNLRVKDLWPLPAADALAPPVQPGGRPRH